MDNSDVDSDLQIQLWDNLNSQKKLGHECTGTIASKQQSTRGNILLSSGEDTVPVTAENSNGEVVESVSVGTADMQEEICPIPSDETITDSAVNKHITGKERTVIHTESNEGAFDALRVKLDDVIAEKKILAKNIEVVQKKLKESEEKIKKSASIDEKLIKTTKLKDQMSAAVQSLKEENDRHKKQQQIFETTTTKDATTIKDLQKNLEEKEEEIQKHKLLIAERELTVQAHRDISFGIMDEFAEDGNEETSTKIHKILISTEQKVKQLEKEIADHLCTEERMEIEIQRVEETKKESIEEISNQLINFQREMEDKESYAAKETQKLKDALNESEKERATLGNTIRKLEKELDACRTKKEVEELTTTTLECTDQYNQTDFPSTTQCESHNCSKIAIYCDACKMKGINGLKTTIKENEKQITDLKQYSKHVDEELVDIQNQKKELFSENKELKKVYEAITRNEQAAKEELQKATALRNGYQGNEAALKEERKQLLYLNSMLKQGKDLLEDKIRKHICTQTAHKHNEERTEIELLPKTGVNVDNMRISNTTDAESTNIDSLCHHEIKEMGSCTRREKCRYSHTIPENVSQNKENILKLLSSFYLFFLDLRKVSSFVIVKYRLYSFL